MRSKREVSDGLEAREIGKRRGKGRNGKEREEEEVEGAKRDERTEERGERKRENHKARPIQRRVDVHRLSKKSSLGRRARSRRGRNDEGGTKGKERGDAEEVEEGKTNGRR